MKTTLLFIFNFLFMVAIFAEPVSILTAKKAAQKQYAMMAEKASLPLYDLSGFSLKLTYTNSSFGLLSGSKEEQNLFYVFNVNENDGFVIVSADDNALPVIGYALKGNYNGENLPPALQGLLERRAEEITELMHKPSIAVIEVKNEWTLLLGQNLSRNFKSFTAVNPLMSTTWNQAPYYNDLCPYDYNYNELTVTGCPATAMAQIMKYWNYPTNGTSYHSYNSESYGTLSANFGATTYDWNNMPNSLSGSNNAIAQLMFHCGVAVEMQYGVAATGGSGGYVIEAQSPIQHCCEYAFKTYFGYKSTLQGLFREDYNDATWIQMLKADLDAGRPIQYAGFGQGGGHTWVCDGYDNSNFFHMNWGWGGVYDGYYSLNDLSPGTGGAGGGSGSFNSGQQALIGIEPVSGGGGGGGGTQFDLRAYSNMYVDPYPINFAYAFDVSIDIGNFDDSNFTGGLAAALFNEQGEFVDIIEELTGISLQTGYYDTYTFHTDGMLATPGTYYIGIYYKSGTGDWAIIGAGDYANYASVDIVGPANDMQMYSDINLNPVGIVSNQAFQITFDIANYSNQAFSGLVSADLYDSDGNYLAELASTTLELSAGYYMGDIQFNCPGVDVPAGSYILAIWDQPNGQDWILVGSDDYSNPITIQIAAPQLPADVYENNDEIENAYLLPLNIPGTQVVINTEGSTIHTGNDMDYYRLDLPTGFQYKITPRAHDSYNSGNGITYTDDVLWAFGAGGNWTEVYDDVLDGFFVMEGGQTVYFFVSNYYQGQTGTYLLEITIEKGIFGVDEIKDPGLVTLYPNPASDKVILSSTNWSALTSPLNIDIVDMTGRSVYSEGPLNPDTGKLDIELPDLKKGVYYLRLTGQKGFIDKKLVIIK
jgi:hypothetical protein